MMAVCLVTVMNPALAVITPDNGPGGHWALRRRACHDVSRVTVTHLLSALLITNTINSVKITVCFNDFLDENGMGAKRSLSPIHHEQLHTYTHIYSTVGHWPPNTEENEF